MTAAPATFTVSPSGPSLRLDQLLMRRAGLSRRQARLCISLGRVRVNGRTARIVARRPAAGAAVTWELPAELATAGAQGAPDAAGPECSSGGRARSLRPQILYLDRDLVVIDKPAGLLSEPDRFGSPSVLCRLAALLAARGEDDSLWLVHRLDAGTSGVMVLGRRPQAARMLSAAFAARQVEKVYLALALGGIAGPCSVSAPIARIKGTRHGVHAGGKPALTQLRPRHLPEGAPQGAGRVVVSLPRRVGQLVEARPRSGRTHQIRVHLAALGCPIVGDGLYGGPQRTPAGTCGLGAMAVPRPMLHACRLALRHPRDQSTMHWVAPLPVDFLVCAASFGLSLPAAANELMEL